MICYAFLPIDNFWYKLAARIVLLPLIVGVSYEVIRYAAKKGSGLMALLTKPGLWLQRITTQGPIGFTSGSGDPRVEPCDGSGEGAGRSARHCVIGIRMQYKERLDQAEERFNELTDKMSDPAVINDGDQYRKVSKARSALEETVSKYGEWKRVDRELRDAKAMLTETDPDMLQMAQLEVARLEPELAQIEQDLHLLLLPKDPNDEKNIVIEIRKGAGGDEASLFAGEVFRMYTRYAEEQGWKVEVTSLSESSVGGLSEVIAMVSGRKVYSRLKYESGVHRVQRVPQTETQGRVHTSTITVAVMPEADEVDVQIEAKDLRIDTFCSSGPGGQSVNTTYSAVRITHLPTNTVVSCQDEKSQIKNRSKAMQVLRSRLYQLELDKQLEAIGKQRKDQVGTGDRSEKIRTYNFPQNRLTDHRVGLTLHQLDLIMEGRLQPVVDAVTTFYQAERLRDQGEAA
jgi:peptide chain release factor 1